MKYISKYATQFRLFVGGLTTTAVLIASAGSAYAAPTSPAHSATPPTSPSSGVQAKPSVAPGSQDAKASAALGSTNLVKTDSSGRQLSSSSVQPLVGNVANVDFQAPINYCYRGLTYAPVRNATTALKYVQVRVYNQGTYRDIYTSIAANSTAYPAFYNTEGAFSAYLYVWNGSSYQYDEYRGGTNTCNVSVARTYNTGGWVQLKIQNLGTAYATQQSTELAPYPASGTYTGVQYDYPAAGGAAIYRWFYVGTSPYGIVSNTLGSYYAPYLFSGDL